MARPMPRPAPVTTTTASFSWPIGTLLLILESTCSKLILHSCYSRSTSPYYYYNQSMKYPRTIPKSSQQEARFLAELTTSGFTRKELSPPVCMLFLNRREIPWLSAQLTCFDHPTQYLARACFGQSGHKLQARRGGDRPKFA